MLLPTTGSPLLTSPRVGRSSPMGKHPENHSFSLRPHRTTRGWPRHRHPQQQNFSQLFQSAEGLPYPLLDEPRRALEPNANTPDLSLSLRCREPDLPLTMHDRAWRQCPDMHDRAWRQCPDQGKGASLPRARPQVRRGSRKSFSLPSGESANESCCNLLLEDGMSESVSQ